MPEDPAGDHTDQPEPLEPRSFTFRADLDSLHLHESGPHGVTVVIGGMVVVVPSVTPVPVPPHWDHGERLSRVDLMGVGTRFRAAAVATTSAALREVLLDAAERLFVTAGERL
ncbi:hypothetical protein [Lentzea sp. NPDC055074]